jgi:hypothetical protein
MIHFWAFFFTTIFAALMDTRMKNFYQSFICLVFFAVGVIGVMISVLVWAVSYLVNVVRN